MLLNNSDFSCNVCSKVVTMRAVCALNLTFVPLTKAVKITLCIFLQLLGVFKNLHELHATSFISSTTYVQFGQTVFSFKESNFTL